MTHAAAKAPPTAADPLADLGRRPLIMGVLNVTPDSFSDGGRFDDAARAVAQARLLAAEGADVLDVGGESTRPGHAPVSAEEERARVVPVIAALRRDGEAAALPISIDTYKAATARAALEAGAAIVNDIWGLQREPEIAHVAAAHGAPVIIMHNRESADPTLDVIAEFRRFFDVSIAIARAAGIPDRHIVLDIGFGFGKSRAQNLEAIRRLPELKAFGYPVLVGASRKSTLGVLTGRPVEQRLAATIASHAVALSLGADIIRVHDVAAHVDALRVVAGILDPEGALARAPGA
ncbi:dihydropteroate synthase [Chelatococcus reniformis]|uniref:Dihydropteroate synthase n=1 Tax=Chelatococcus reniformis TaxID=1494448 RepID=A0A916UWS6_9HYPH|nr:dihydropteroate synthase [Chelatococcus reniformis]GGC92186.1 dihydropteroate synthase [Chelatococcus reniformis]